MGKEMSTHIPIDVLIDVFLRLPAKSLLCFKSVCKQWYDVISDPEFGERHLERSLATQTNLHFIVKAPSMKMPVGFDIPVYYMADFDTFDHPIDLDHPFDDEVNILSVIGSCRGLLCICVCDYEPTLFLYNPTTQTHRILPFLATAEPFHPRRDCNYGFGYDSLSRDYKCVRLLQHFNKETRDFKSEVMVYSFRTNAWKTVVDAPCRFSYLSAGSVLLHEIVHWFGRDTNDVHQYVVTFNLRDETFSSISVPNFYLQGTKQFNVGVLDGCLCLSVSSAYNCNLWVMKEYGVAGSWTVMFSYALVWPDNKPLRPISYSLDGKRLFVKKYLSVVASLDLETMKAGDLKTTHFDKAEDLKTTHFDKCFDAHVCVENLLMLNFADNIPVEEEPQGKK